jgi:hypothetical protein
MGIILNSSTSYILLNRVLGKAVHCKRGVTQGDLLSSLLFVLTANLLQSILNKAKEIGLISLPLPLWHFLDFSIIKYVDDTLLIIMEASARQLTALKGFLYSFGTSTCLKIKLC